MSAMLLEAGRYGCVSAWLSVLSWNCDELQSETLLLMVSLEGLPSGYSGCSPNLKKPRGYLDSSETRLHHHSKFLALLLAKLPEHWVQCE